ncbi:tetratricopeptide repeat protein [Flavobacteriaceae bacterium F89]|uniref:Tetratricopeptide repeat protein n=1 Tax=Cerina litoralis TaxID=2874477 RepID=A0AAE3EQP8_9FLAO|nr:tetratricopeptide repeat protein [Cerina litoralis]MCG2459357.1 tetratricopeptide repeat protein [Cerina litoralis]
MKINLVYILFFVCFISYGQSDDKARAKALRASKDLTWDANKELSEDKFVDAEANYRKAIAKSDKNVAAPYNLGNAYYKNKSYSEAFSRYKEAGEMAPDKKVKHNAFHNMGNVFMERKEYEKAVEAYKQALRNDPEDDETRYNLALAKELLKKQQDENKKNDQNKDNKDKKDQDKKDDKDKNEGDNKDENKDNKDKDDKGDKGDEKKEDNKKEDGDGKKEQQQPPQEGDKPQEQQQQRQPRPNQLSPQQVRNLLEATQNEEKKVQEKMDAQKVKGSKIRNEKDW